MALFGLSPLCLSVLASYFFIDPGSGLLDIVRFLKFMAVLTAATHLLGYFVLQIPPASSVAAPICDRVDCDTTDENSILLPRKTGDELLGNHFIMSRHPIKDRSFWLLWCYCFLVIGAVSVVWMYRYHLNDLFRRPKW